MAELHSNLCGGDWAFFKKNEGVGKGSSEDSSEIIKGCQRKCDQNSWARSLAIMGVRTLLPQSLGDRGHIPPNDDTSKARLPCLEKDTPDF